MKAILIGNNYYIRTMKKYILPLMSIAMLMAMASCSSSDDEVAEIKEESKLVPMTFTATQESNVGTRTALSTGNSVIWKTGDMISVFDGNGEEGNHQFSLTGDASLGKFSGIASSEATSFTAVYPYTEGATLVSDGSVSGITLPAEQTATLNSFDPKAALMMAVSTTENKNQLDFKNAVSLVKVTTEFACKSIVLSANENIAGTGTLTYNTNAPSISFTSNQSTTITLKPATVSNSFAAGTYYMVVPSITLNGFTITFTAENGKEYTRKSDKSTTFNRSKIKDFGSFATNGDYWYDTSRGDIVRADQEVDLGLTINQGGKTYKVIFAKSNLTKDGLAANEYDYGDYFAWGATEPWYHSATETWKQGKEEGYTETTAPTLSKTYNKNDVLSSSDDAARQILGGGWQIHTTEIWVALYGANLNKVYWGPNGNKGLETISEIKGMKITRKDDSNTYIFLPAAGYFSGTGHLFGGRAGSYCSGTAYLSNKAYTLEFDDRPSVVEQSKSLRYLGRSVRPVRLVAVD